MPSEWRATHVARASTILAARARVLAASLRVWAHSGTKHTPERRHVRDGLHTSHALGDLVKPVCRQHTAPQLPVFGKQLVPRQGMLRIALGIPDGGGHLHGCRSGTALPAS